MPSICPKSARLTLPNVLKSIFYFELAPQLRSSTRPLNRLSLSRHGFKSRRAIATVSIDSIPVTSAQQPQTPSPDQNEPSATAISSNVASQGVNDQISTQPTASTKSSPSRRRTKTKPNTPSGKQSKGYAKKTAQKDQKSIGSKPQRKREGWEIQKEALKEKFPNGWSPPKKLSPDAMEGIRHLNSVAPDQFTTPVLAEEFKVSPEAIRRILKSKWRPSGTDLENRRKRWEKRHERIWSHMSELGLRPKRADDSASVAATLLYDQKKSKTSGESW
ncbi:hypothetical protein BDW62DRAFT_182102 [Aspergillus aurantiobrunneus]